MVFFDEDGVQETDGILHFEVIKSDSATFSAPFNEGEVYKNFSSPKGLALIINNKKFVTPHSEKCGTDEKNIVPCLSERRGTEIDEINIANLFSQLGYDTEHIYRDLSGKEMLKTAQNFVNDKAHKACDSCVVVVLTHGKYDILLGVDGKEVNVHEFLGCFNSENAPFLKGKPKLFFLQACRGAKFDCSVDGIGSLFSCWKQKQEKEENIPYLSSATLQTLPPFIDNSRHPVECDMLIFESDMLISYATPPNYVSWRNPSNGSWFIQSICEIFSVHSAKKEICSLLRKVNKRVADVYSMSKHGLTYKQVPEFKYRLLKKFYFFPGIKNEFGTGGSMLDIFTNTGWQEVRDLLHINPEKKKAITQSMCFGAPNKAAEIVPEASEDKTAENKILSAESGGKKCLKSIHETYLRAYDSVWKVDMTQGPPKVWGNWYVEDWGGKVVFKANYSPGRFLRAHADGRVDLVDRPQEWTTWTPFKNDDDSWSFLSVHGRWLSASINGKVSTEKKCNSCEHFWLEWW